MATPRLSNDGLRLSGIATPRTRPVSGGRPFRELQVAEGVFLKAQEDESTTQKLQGADRTDQAEAEQEEAETPAT